MRSDDSIPIANGVMLAQVLSVHGEYIILCEVKRRIQAEIDTRGIGALDSSRRWDSGKIKVGVYAFDVLRSSPTHYLLFGSLLG